VPPFERDIAIWKMSCANTDSVVRKSEDDTLPVTSDRGGYCAKLNAKRVRIIEPDYFSSIASLERHPLEERRATLKVKPSN
jgi:hypothetical protein